MPADEVHHLSGSAVGALRTFAGWVARGSVGQNLLAETDYWTVMRQEPSLAEQVFAIFGNVLTLDQDGKVINAKQAERRAAQYMEQYMTGVEAVPPFEPWEVELHNPFGM